MKKLLLLVLVCLFLSFTKTAYAQVTDINLTVNASPFVYNYFHQCDWHLLYPCSVNWYVTLPSTTGYWIMKSENVTGIFYTVAYPNSTYYQLFGNEGNITRTVQINDTCTLYFYADNSPRDLCHGSPYYDCHINMTFTYISTGLPNSLYCPNGTLQLPPPSGACTIIDTSQLRGFPMIIMAVLGRIANFILCNPLILGFLVAGLVIYRIFKKKS